MMLKIMIILLASDDEGITLRLHSHGRLLAKLVVRNLQWGGGLSRRCEAKLKKFTIEIETVFCPKLGEDQKEKKELRPCWNRVLRANSLQVQS